MCGWFVFAAFLAGVQVAILANGIATTVIRRGRK